MGKKGYILSGAALLAALTLLAGCGKNNDTDDKNKDKPDTDPAQEIVLVQPEAADVPVDFETAQKAWPDAYAYMKIPNATGCAIREGGFIAQHPVDDGWYLYRDLDGNDNKAGTLYTEATYNDTKLDDPVTVVYGHNMANRTMFGGLQSYAETLKFDDKAVVEVYQSGRKMTYRIFAGIPYDTTHILYYHDFTDEQVFTDFFAALDKAATDKSYSGSDHKNGFAPSAGSVNVNRDDLPKWGDKVLVLSVCKNGDDAHRYLVMAKLVEDSAEPLRMTREEAEKAGLTDRIIGVAPAEDDAAADTTGKTDTAKTDTAGEGHGLAGLGVDEGQTAGPQGDGIRRVGRTVLAVTCQRQTAGGELYPYLVGTAGVESDAHQRHTVGAVHSGEGQAGLPRAGGGGVRHIGQTALGITGQQVRQDAGGLGRRAAQDSQILLGKAALPYLLGQQGRRHTAAGKDHDAGHLGVQPVDGADAVGVQLGAEQLRHTAGLIGGQYAHGLYRHHDAVVLIENVHGRHLLTG